MVLLYQVGYYVNTTSSGMPDAFAAVLRDSAATGTWRSGMTFVIVEQGPRPLHGRHLRMLAKCSRSLSRAFH
jgi:hypothetical protein